MIQRISSLVMLILAVVMIPTAASATYPSDPNIEYPVYRSISAGSNVVVQLNAPADSWGIRKFAKQVDAKVDGLVIRTSGPCWTADVCVTVVADWYTEAEMATYETGGEDYWGGLMVPGDGRNRTILLNTYTMGRSDPLFRSILAAHELGHALGLGHREGNGLMSDNMYHLKKPDFRWDELSTLQTWYSTPHFAPTP